MIDTSAHLKYLYLRISRRGQIYRNIIIIYLNIYRKIEEKELAWKMQKSIKWPRNYQGEIFGTDFSMTKK